jgi:hypothetical protein
MGEAIFGLIGVVVGAVVSGLASLLLERRRERVVARTAARLVQAELSINESRLSHTDSPSYEGGPAWLASALRRTHGWARKPALAHAVNAEAWGYLRDASVAFDVLNRLNRE